LIVVFWCHNFAVLGMARGLVNISFHLIQ